MEVILIGDFNGRLQIPKYTREENLVMELEDSGLVNMPSHFLPRRRYRGAGNWTW